MPAAEAMCLPRPAFLILFSIWKAQGYFYSYLPQEDAPQTCAMPRVFFCGQKKGGETYS